jgi:hypothetical protein
LNKKDEISEDYEQNDDDDNKVCENINTGSHPHEIDREEVPNTSLLSKNI